MSIDISLDERDSAFLQVLSKHASHDLIFARLLARLDERPVVYSYTNSDDLVAKDDRHIQDINRIAASVGMPSIQTSPIRRRKQDSPTPDATQRAHERPLADYIQALHQEPFEKGLRGLGEAFKTWRSRPYQSQDPNWDIDRFANAIGYRLLELGETSGLSHVEFQIRLVAEGAGYSNDELLTHIGEGLERASFRDVAVLAYTLQWTRGRAHGGWLRFGGETFIDSLQRAASLNAKYTLQVLAAEIEPLVREYDTIGVTQALVYALAKVDWKIDWPEQKTSAEMVFDTWDSAAAVIGWRLPWTDSIDDPELPYVRPSGPNSPDQLALAFAAATFGGIGHPSREQKRRSLVAAGIALRAEFGLVGAALALALTHLDEPATLSWLLAHIESISIAPKLLIEGTSRLKTLAQSQYLCVRTAARKLLTQIDVEVPPLPLGQSSSEIVASAPDDFEKKRKNAELLVKDECRRRMPRIEQMVPTIRESVVNELSKKLAREEFSKRLNRQLESLTSRADFRWPDAFIANNELFEEVLQRISGSSRVTLASLGQLVSDPEKWEEHLYQRVIIDPWLSLALEASRIPRPKIVPPPGHGDAIWNLISAAPSGALPEADRLGATLEVRKWADAPTVDGLSSFAGWKVLGLFETRESSPDPTWPSKEASTSIVCGALEMRRVDSDGGRDIMPVGDGLIQVWWSEVPATVPSLIVSEGRAIVCFDRANPITTDGRTNLGYGCAPLAPSAGLVRSLGLRPSGTGVELVDEQGMPAVATHCWRSHYVVSEYHWQWPALAGTRIIVRPDIFERIGELCGDLLRWRLYTEGTSKFAVKET